MRCLRRECNDGVEGGGVLSAVRKCGMSGGFGWFLRLKTWEDGDVLDDGARFAERRNHDLDL